MEYEVELPDTPEERNKLADVLWNIYDTMLLYSEMIIQSDNLVKSQFIEMFGNDRNDTLENLSVSWNKGQSLKKDDINEGGQNECIHYGELFTKYGPAITKIMSHTNINPKIISRYGDILFPASDVTPEGLTKCSTILLDNVILGGDIIVMRPLDIMNPIYLSYAIRMQKYQLLKLVTGSLVRHISAKSLKTVLVPVPNRKRQNDFVKFYKQIDKSKIEIDHTIKSLQKLYKAIITENIK